MSGTPLDRNKSRSLENANANRPHIRHRLSFSARLSIRHSDLSAWFSVKPRAALAAFLLSTVSRQTRSPVSECSVTHSRCIRRISPKTLSTAATTTRVAAELQPPTTTNKPRRLLRLQPPTVFRSPWACPHTRPANTIIRYTTRRDRLKIRPMTRVSQPPANFTPRQQTL